MNTIYIKDLIKDADGKNPEQILEFLESELRFIFEDMSEGEQVSLLDGYDKNITITKLDNENRFEVKPFLNQDKWMLDAPNGYDLINQRIFTLQRIKEYIQTHH